MSAGYDYIIVGGGSSACVAAWRLVKDHGARVLIVERGPAKASGLSGFYLPMPAAWMKGIQGSPVVELHEPVPQRHLDGRAPKVGQAAILGGGSSVNAMVYMRGQHEDYDTWDRSLGQGSGWSFARYAAALPRLGMQPPLPRHLAWRRWPLARFRHRRRLSADRRLHSRRSGTWRALYADFNGARQLGVGTMQYTTHRGPALQWRHGLSRSDASTARLSIETGCTVPRLIIEKGRCTGVAYLRGGQEIVARATSEVLVAAGSYNTPKILMLSGVGPAAQLAKHGIACLADLPGVGENLQDHHEVPVVAATSGHHGYFGEDRGLRALKNGLQYLMFRTGPVASVGVEACACIDPDGSDRPSIQMYCIPTVYIDGDVKGVERQEGITLNACLMRPKSRGTVRLRSANPLDKPVVDNNYLAEPDDLRLEIAGLRYARDILAAKPLAQRVTRELLPGPGVTDDAGLADHCRKTVKTTWHPSGTARMGSDGDTMAVLDTRCRVRGIDGLRVIDASAMPFVPSGNTNAPTMALADRAVSLMMASRSKAAF